MKNQRTIEIVKGSTYTFTHFEEEQNTLIVPSTAYITITDSEGNSILAQTAMTIAADGVCTYAWNSGTYAAGLDYIVKYELDSLPPVVRIFDIFLYVFVNNVTDDDLFAENDSIKDDSFNHSGTASGGTTATLIDSDLYEADDTYNGGLITMFIDNVPHEREITDYVKSTGTITFTPVVDVAISSGINYSLRGSYQDGIDLAGTKVQLDFKKMAKRASLVIDSYTLIPLIVYKFFEMYFFKLVKEDGNEYDIKFQFYKDKYYNELGSIPLVYDSDGDGLQDEVTKASVVWFR